LTVLMKSVAISGAIMCAATTLAAQSLDRQVRDAVSGAKLGGADIGVSIIDVQSGKQLVDIKPSGKSALMPASNLKLLTSGAALLTVGKDFEFKTDFVLDGDRLIVKGSGDPALADPDLLAKMGMSVDKFVDRLVEGIKNNAPTAKIKEVVVDDRVFDRQFVHPDWPADQLRNAYCAQICGVNFHANVLGVYVSPGPTVGAEANARPEPSGNWINIRRLAKTVGAGNNEVWLEREKEPYSFRLQGTVKSLQGPFRVTVDNPAVFFGRVLADRIKKFGIASNDGITSRAAKQDDTFGDGSVVATVHTPINVALERCNIDSENLYAESLLKLAGHTATGQPGSWSNGTALVRMKVQEALGADIASSLELADGSGLSRNNRVSAETFARWLSYMAKDKSVGQTFVRSLGIAGKEGTVKRRFKKQKLANEVRAKSGYIRGVRTLSGYVTNLDTGRMVAFSVLVNDVPANGDARSKELHEDVVDLVDNWLEVQEKSGKSAGER
jgi:D-alanyl-D-alanine carboxypeptidase/D-alanyl-D-alanine-endopeptidase (penicillin-binding protein 4)